MTETSDKLKAKLYRILEARDKFTRERGAKPNCIFVDEETARDLVAEIYPDKVEAGMDLLHWFTWRGMDVILVDYEGFLGFGWQS